MISTDFYEGIRRAGMQVRCPPNGTGGALTARSGQAGRCPLPVLCVSLSRTLPAACQSWCGTGL